LSEVRRPAFPAVVVPAAVVRPMRSPAADVVRRLRRSKGAVIGSIILGLLVVIAILAPLLAPFDPAIQDVDARLQPPGASHWLGTDLYGRDVLSRILHGARISLRVGLMSVAIGCSVGLVLGLTAGYYRGWTDTIIMRFIDAMLAFPSLLLALSLVAVLGGSLRNVMIAVGISSVPGYTRLVRGTVLSARENVYIEAARALGCANRLIMFRHILPNVFAPILVLATLGTASTIIVASALSYLGMGAQPPTPEWGLMLSEGRSYLRRAWWISTFPGLAIMVTTLAINLLGDGLRDALDPRLRI
jgi:peptide/nickel transport system permease protein